MIAALQRLTTAYVETEDRMCISGEDGEGRVQVLWLTQRLLARLVPHLCGWLERHAPGLEATVHAPAAGEGDLARNLAQGFAQQAAQAQLASQAPEPVAAQAAGWRVNAVDLHATPQGVQLVLRGELETQQAAMALNGQALRQWLGIVHGQYRKAEWPLAVWPAWMAQEVLLSPGSAAGVLH